MAYSQGGLIAAADYNGFVGSNNTTSGTLNYVWSTGNGQYGYGQSGLATVSGAGTVTATQWASLINTMNTVSQHQSGSSSGLSAPTAGGLITYLSTVSSGISTYNTNHLSFASQGSTATGTVYSPNPSATNNSTYGESTIAQRVATFSSPDAARYFFNAGGQLNFIITSVANNDGTSRSQDGVNVIGSYFGGVNAIRATTNGGISGSGGTVAANNTSIGYYGLTTSPVTYHQVNTTNSTYSGDYVKFYMSSNGPQGSNGDNGTVINMYINYYTAHTSTTSGLYGSSGDTFNITVNHRVDVVYPESSYLSNTWGTVTIS